MTYYLLPRTSCLIYKSIDCFDNGPQPTPIISNSLSCYLYQMKECLNNCEKDWDTFKKYTNPYEYIHSSIPFKKKSISKHKPLSRSYFKMIEIINTFNLTFDTKPLCSFHLAEGPGGFIEAIANLRNCSYDKYIGMTILDNNNDPNIPAWKKTENFLRQHKNVIIETGADKTGNILSIDNFTYCKEKYASSMDLVTADGGFDFSLDFNNQEINITQLLFGQIIYALTMQKKGGVFILKIFDTFMQHSIDLLYILSSFYEKVYIIKPQTSRYANSEKYVICKGFLFNSCENFYPFLYRAFDKMLSCTNKNNTQELFIHRFLNIPIPFFFINKLEEFNAIFGQQQIENIHYTISLISSKHKQDKIDNLIKLNIQKCVQWCMKNNVEINFL
uniref:Ribosomal RNA methyltransferase FtsJ domain-containing protein n=1 Tax=viral metagenome TaxID=1070528 RepID=A0A6C0E980_9ZZZZ